MRFNLQVKKTERERERSVEGRRGRTPPPTQTSRAASGGARERRAPGVWTLRSAAFDTRSLSPRPAPRHLNASPPPRGVPSRTPGAAAPERVSEPCGDPPSRFPRPLRLPPTTGDVWSLRSPGTRLLRGRSLGWRLGAATRRTRASRGADVRWRFLLEHVFRVHVCLGLLRPSNLSCPSDGGALVPGPSPRDLVWRRGL